MASRALKYALALVVIVCVLVSGGWWIAAQAVERALQQWADDRRTEGYEVAWDSLVITGFPIRLDGRLEGARLARAEDGQEWLWLPPALTLHFFPLAPSRVDLAAPGSHALTVTADGQTNHLNASTDAATARLRLGLSGDIEAVSATVTGLQIDNPEQDLRLTADSGTFVAERQPSADLPALLAGAALSGVKLPAALDGPLGTELTTLAAEAIWHGDLPSGPTDPALARWRDNGGTLDIRRVNLHWGPVRAAATGEMSLDGTLQPQGQFDTEISGMDNAITAFEQARLLDQRGAALARIAIAALSRAPADGGAPIVRLPLAIAQRQVTLGPVPLLTLPEIRWR